MLKIKELLANKFLEILKSYEIGNPKCYDDLLLFMQYMETTKDKGIDEYNNYILLKML